MTSFWLGRKTPTQTNKITRLWRCDLSLEEGYGIEPANLGLQVKHINLHSPLRLCHIISTNKYEDVALIVFNWNTPFTTAALLHTNIHIWVAGGAVTRSIEILHPPA